MFFIKMFLIPFFILFTYMPYSILKRRESENEALFLRGFLLIYFLATLFLLISIPYMGPMPYDFTGSQSRLLFIIAALWAIVAIGLFLHHAFHLYGYFSYMRQMKSVISRHDAVPYLLHYLSVSFLLAVYWFHPAIRFWYRPVMHDILPQSLRKEYNDCFFPTHR